MMSETVDHDIYCNIHQGKTLLFVCETCIGKLACTSCVTSTHKAHSLADLTQCIPNKLELIRRFIHTTEEQDIPAIEAHVEKARTVLKNTKQSSVVHIEQIRSYSELLRQCIENVSASRIATFENIIGNKIQLQEHCIEKSANLQVETRALIEECKMVVDSGSNVAVVQMEAEIAERQDMVLPAIPEVSVPPFERTINTDSMLIIESLFEISSIENANTSSEQVASPSDKQEEPQDCTLQRHPIGPLETSEIHDFKEQSRISSSLDTEVLSPSPALVGDVHTVSEFSTTPYFALRICPTENGNAWVLNSDTRKIFNVDHTGAVNKEINLNIYPRIRIRDICFHDKSSELFCCCNDSIIRQIGTHHSGTAGLLIDLFHTPDEACSIAVIKCRNIVLGKIGGNIQVYQRSKDGGYSIKYDCNIGLNFSIHCISVCGQTGHILAACGHHGVLVLDYQLHHMYTYLGRCTSQAEGQLETTKRFESFKALFGKNSNMIVIDDNQGEIHQVDGETGQYKQTLIREGFKNIWTLGIQGNILWIVLNTPDYKVKRLTLCETKVQK